MKRIASFSVNHDLLEPGMYLSRIDGDAVTYDIRMKKPNGGDYLANGAMHTIEHLFATYARNTAFADQILYVGPMGCRTGFYLIVRQEPDESADELNRAVLAALREALAGIAAHTGKVPGAHRRECGNYRCLSLSAAKEEAARYLEALDSRPQSFEYEKQEKGI